MKAQHLDREKQVTTPTQLLSLSLSLSLSLLVLVPLGRLCEMVHAAGCVCRRLNCMIWHNRGKGCLEYHKLIQDKNAQSSMPRICTCSHINRRGTPNESLLEGSCQSTNEVAICSSAPSMAMGIFCAKPLEPLHEHGRQGFCVSAIGTMKKQFVKRQGEKTKFCSKINEELVTRQMAFRHCLLKACPRWQGLCSHPAQLWATADSVPRFEALGTRF